MCLGMESGQGPVGDKGDKLPEGDPTGVVGLGLAATIGRECTGDG